MRQLAIIADDLSSATDCGIQMARSGLRSLVMLGEFTQINDPESVDVVSLDTNSRAEPPKISYNLVKQVAQALLANGYDQIYKSIDSTLRGNLGAEVDAVLNTAVFDCAVIAPAFPHYGRTTRDGKHYWNGIPITQTEFARDPQAPVRDDDLVKLFERQSIRSAGLVDLQTLHAGAKAVEQRMSSLLGNAVELIIFDAVEETDLDRIVENVSASKCSVLWVGSTGLARCIPSTLNISQQVPLFIKTKTVGKPGLLVIGSVSAITKKQMKNCLDGGVAHPLPIDPYRIIEGKDSYESQISQYVRLIRETCNKGENTAIFLDSSREDVPLVQALGKKKGLDNLGVANQLVSSLADVVRRIVEEDLISGVVVSGGDTAKAICDRLGASGIEILEEVEPGIPLCRLRGSFPLLMVTKAGAFGTPEVLIDSLDWIRRVKVDG
jgi:uncharacterized protein YgbK (DUF1537 family)